MWRSKTAASMTGLKAVARQKIMNDVIKPNNVMEDTGKVNRRILVLDQLGMKVISGCCTMSDIYDEGIILIEDLLKVRDPLYMYEAVYLITPIETSVDALIADFAIRKKPMYKAVHIFFVYTCPDQFFDKLSKANIKRKIKTFKEINMGFVANERQIFTFGDQKMFQLQFNSKKVATVRDFNFEQAAQLLSTVCVTLGEYPAVRYRSSVDDSAVELAQMVQKKLDYYKTEYPKLGQGLGKMRSQLIILDRGFDCVSPVLHELTYQAMAYDNALLDNSIFKYKVPDHVDPKEVLLNDNDELWIKYRHEHIADVTRNLATDLKTFVDNNRVPSIFRDGNISARDFSNAIQAFPQYQKELSAHCTHLNLVQHCSAAYNDTVNRLYKIEQELALGTDTAGVKIEDHMKDIAPILSDKTVSKCNKTRIIVLYVLSKRGISEETFNKLVKTAQLSSRQIRSIKNLNTFGVSVIANGKVKNNCFNKTPRKERDHDEIEMTDAAYPASRWTPVVKQIMEDCAGNKLDPKRFPFMAGRSVATVPTPIISARFSASSSKNIENKQQNDKIPKLIIYIIGGMTYSEMRSAYEVNKSTMNCEVILGSSHILTANEFMTSLESVPK